MTILTGLRKCLFLMGAICRMSVANSHMTAQNNGTRDRQKLFQSAIFPAIAILTLFFGMAPVFWLIWTPLIGAGWILFKVVLRRYSPSLSPSGLCAVVIYIPNLILLKRFRPPSYGFGAILFFQACSLSWTFGLTIGWAFRLQFRALIRRGEATLPMKP